MSFRPFFAKTSARTVSGSALFCRERVSCLSVLHVSGFLGFGVIAVPEHPDSGFKEVVLSIATDG